MGKKIKSKARLDKYYYLAKEHGFRSRAAFKLIQLNKKFHFLESSNCLIDLCAAPGGWLQVASKHMPISSIKIGVDLDPIKPIPGITTFQADITSEKCRFLIRKEIKHFKADVVLNDGAPNVGGQWSKDAYNQSELVLFAVKLATEFLKAGGWFITKIFRSSDYNSLIYVLRQLFHKVDATKPLASRSESAEIFVVCSGYKAPSSIDPRLLDPKFALKQLEEEDEMKSNVVRSIKAIFEKGNNRGGYSSSQLYHERSFKEFIECANPYLFLSEVHKIKIDTDDCKNYIGVIKCPIDYQLYFDDIQVLGKKEVQELIIWRNKIRMRVMKTKNKEQEPSEGEKPQEEEGHQQKILEEMDEELKHWEKQKKKKQEIEKKKQETNSLRMKMSFIRQQDNDEEGNDVDFDQKMFEYIQKNKINIENLEEGIGKQIGEVDDVQEIEEEEDEEDAEGEVEESDLDEDEYINRMNEEVEENLRLYNEKKNLTGKKIKKRKEKKMKEEFEDNEKSDNIFYEKQEEDEEFDEDKVEDPVIADKEDNDNDNDNDSDKDNDSDTQQIQDLEIENPLRKAKNLKQQISTEKVKDIPQEQNEEENLDYDTDEEKLLGKKTKRKMKEKTLYSTKEAGESEIQEDIKSDSCSSSVSYDTDEAAEIRAIAKKMLRKKDRIKILNSTYNRYAFSDQAQAPKWFVEEENQHNRPIKPVTKEEINIEKLKMKKVNDRMPKKIYQAKMRKKVKIAKRMEKVKKKAEVICNQDEINEFSKVKQIEKLYKRELAKGKEKKKYIVSRSFKTKSGKPGRNIRFVDRRLKKDKRALKARKKQKEGKKRRR